MSAPWTTRRLALENLRRKPLRTACLIATVAALSFVLFGGTILSDSLRNGFASMQNRLGADLIVVPEGYDADMENVLIKGEPSYFYFRESVLQTTAAVPGVERATAQFFLASLNAACCSSPMQLVGFNPDTDFVIQPWVQGTYAGSLPQGQLLVGNDVLVDADGTIKLFGAKYPVAAKLAPTATGLDVSVFLSRQTMAMVLQGARSVGYHFITDSEPEDSISSVLVKVGPGYSPEKVALQIQQTNPGTKAIVSKSMLAGTASAVAALLGNLRAFGIGVAALALVVLAAVFTITFHERKKEFAILRVLGATGAKLARLVLLESLLASSAGGVLGTGLAALVVFPFSTYIGTRLQLPYLQPDAGTILLVLAGSLLVALATGPLTSALSAVRVAKAPAYQVLREGE